MKQKFSIISIVGRAGAGKGTQAKLLQKKTGFVLIGTGDLLRKRAQKNDVVGKAVKKVLDNGGLMPTPIVFSLWMPVLEKIKNEGSVRSIIFDGGSRKLYEAQMLDEVLEMFGWQGRLRVCYIDISKKEATKRLLLRGRSDDHLIEIKKRLAYFSTEIDPMLRYYKKRKILIKINGEQSTKNIHNEITKKLKGFIK